MSFDYHSATPEQPAGYRDIGLQADRSERIVTIVATSIAVLVVAVIAVLMGMA